MECGGDFNQGPRRRGHYATTIRGIQPCNETHVNKTMSNVELLPFTPISMGYMLERLSSIASKCTAERHRWVEVECRAQHWRKSVLSAFRSKLLPIPRYYVKQNLKYFQQAKEQWCTSKGNSCFFPFRRLLIRCVLSQYWLCQKMVSRSPPSQKHTHKIFECDIFQVQEKGKR